jgi:hypothetical protein
MVCGSLVIRRAAGAWRAARSAGPVSYSGTNRTNSTIVPALPGGPLPGPIASLIPPVAGRYNRAVLEEDRTGVGMTVTTEWTDVAVGRRSMRTLVTMPKGDGLDPGILRYSDIIELAGPLVRMCTQLAGHGFVVAAPEIYHRIEPALMFGSRDPHILPEHASMHDEGPRRDPECSGQTFGAALALLRRTLA